MPATTRPSVDLPQPDSPTRPTTSPSRTVRSTLVDGAHHRLAIVGAERVGEAAGEIDAFEEALRDALDADEFGMPARRIAHGAAAPG
jgi:hypothetical protein